jgi:hypothetical protein
MGTLMAKTINVLLFPIGSTVCLEVYNSLRCLREVKVFAAGSVRGEGKGLFYDRPDDCIDNLPFESEEGFAVAVQEVVEQFNIDLIIPGMDSSIAVLKRLESQQRLSCRVAGPELQVAQVCANKRLTYKVFANNAFCPQFFTDDKNLTYPVFVKPQEGYGSKGAFRANDAAELKAHMGTTDAPLIFCEYLPGKEYTVDCFSDVTHRLRFVQARDRSLVKNGMSTKTMASQQSVQNEALCIAEAIAGQLAMRGAWFFQLKEDLNGNLKLLEVACRIGGSSALARYTGVNLSALTVFDAMGQAVVISPIPSHPVVVQTLKVCAFSALSYQHLYIDFDDCLYLQGRYVNPDLMAVIYHAKNHHKQVHLLSRHKGNLQKSLARLGLSNLFDSVTHITDPSANKSQYMRPHSLLIDDSFRERQDAIQQGFMALDMSEMDLLRHSIT